MRLISTSVIVLSLLAMPVFAQSKEDVKSQIENMHGDSEAFGEAFSTLQDAFLLDDRASLADLAFYPLTVRAGGKEYELQERDDLIDNFDDLLTQETIESLSSQDYANLIVTSAGVGFANGALWMTLVCNDGDCTDTSWGITSINN